MAGYVVLWKLTEKGRKDAKEVLDALKSMPEDLKPSGSKHVGTWLTFGEFDGVTILDVPDDLTMARLLMQSAKLGLVTTRTVRALSEIEFAQVVGQMD